MTNLISQIKISNIDTRALAYKTAFEAEKPENTRPQIKELTSLPTSNILAQFVKAPEKLAAVGAVKDSQPFEWKNDLRSLIQDNKAVIWAMIPRTFNAKDIDRNGLVQDDEDKGTFLNSIGRLDSVAALGVNTLHVLPIHEPGKLHAMGISGSLYSPKDMLEIDPELRDPNDPRDVKEQFKEFIKECHKRGIRVMLDLPSCGSYDMFLKQPEVMAFERNGHAKTPQGWNDIRMMEPWADESKRTLNPYVLDLHKKFVDMCIELGVDGIRADVARAKPTEFWDIIIPYSHSRDPQFAWLAETYTFEDASPQLNMPFDRPEDSLRAGFDTYYGQYHIFNEWNTAKEFTDYVKQNLIMSHRKDMPAKKSLIGSFATHDDISPMFHGGVAFCNLTTGLQASLPMLNPYFVDGFQSGDEYLYKYENCIPHGAKDTQRKLDVHRGKLDIFNHSRKPGGDHPEIGEFMKSAFKMRKEYEDVMTKGSFIPLNVKENADDQIITFARHLNGKTLLVIANRNVNKRQKGAVIVPGLPKGTELKNLVDNYGEKSYFQVKDDGKVAVDMGPARFQIFEVNTPNIEKSGLQVFKQKL